MKSETKKILVPIGFSDQSINALDQAAMFARPIGAEIVLLTVVELDGLLTKIFSNDEKIEAIKKEISVKLDAVADDFKAKHNLPISTVVANGVVYEEIARVAELLKVELVVMGTNGKPNNYKKKFIGSNAYRVVSLVSPPVVTVNGIDMRSEIKSIIFPLVVERRSKEKVGKALHYARMFNASINVIAVAKTESEERKLKPSLVQVEKFIRDAQVPCTSALINAGKKKVRDVIFEYRKSQDGDMIIITEDGDEVRIGLGTTDVEKIIHGAQVPVMCITPSHTKFQNQFEIW